MGQAPYISGDDAHVKYKVSHVCLQHHYYER